MKNILVFDDDAEKIQEICEANDMTEYELIEMMLENIDVEEDSSITSVDRFDGIPDKLKPNLNIKCVTCQFAKWFGNNKVLKCYCREMFSIIYDSENTQDAVIYCENAHKEN